MFKIQGGLIDDILAFVPEILLLRVFFLKEEMNTRFINRLFPQLPKFGNIDIKSFPMR